MIIQTEFAELPTSTGLMRTEVLRPAAPAKAGSQFSMLISGSPGQTYQVQVSSNLTSWSAVATVTNVTGTVPFTEPSATNAPRFYRARLMP